MGAAGLMDLVALAWQQGPRFPSPSLRPHVSKMAAAVLASTTISREKKKKLFFCSSVRMWKLLRNSLADFSLGLYEKLTRKGSGVTFRHAPRTGHAFSWHMPKWGGYASGF